MSEVIRMVVLVENRSHQKDLIAEHGFAMWIEYNDKKILFDTGQSNAVLNNARHLNIDLSQLDAIVLSHGHYDHIGGLAGVLHMAKKATIYLHPKAMKVRYGQTQGEVARELGMGAETLTALRENEDRLCFVKASQEIFPGIVMSGQISRTNDFETLNKKYTIDKQGEKLDEFEDDQALVLKSSKGRVVLLGCAHAGVVNTLDHISEKNSSEKIHAVIGGMHLRQGTSQQMNQTIAAFKTIGVASVYPGHCTGTEMESELAKAYQENSHSLYTGIEIVC